VNRRRLERTLSDLEPFRDPSPEREQYPTPAGLAAHLVHLADLQGDLRRPTLDLGAGTGILAVAAALRGARTVGVEVDPGALSVAAENAARAGVDVDWVLGDAARLPVSRVDGGWTVVTNPPFGAQAGSAGDRPFLAAAGSVAAVSYSVHNAGSRGFLERFAAGEGGQITHAFAADLPVDRQFAFHEDDRRELDVEVFRIEWDR
jgi:putative methylase